MSTDRIDPETLAAFLEGRLSGTEREAVRRKLAEGGEDFDVMADTAAVVAELSEADSTQRNVIPLRRRQIPWKLILPLAAGIGAVLLVPRLMNRTDAPEIALLIEANALSEQVGLPVDWNQVPWPVNRGAGGTVNDGVQFRVGVHTAWLLATARLNDTTATLLQAQEIENQIRNQPGAGASVAVLSSINPDNEASVERAASEIRQLFAGSSWYALGQWAGQARLARKLGATSFFSAAGPAVTELERRASALRAAASPDVTAALEQLVAALRTNAPATTIDTLLDNLIDAAAK